MTFLLQLLNGLQLGSIFALIALGYTMVYGISKLINFAHGDILMWGGYIIYFTIPFFISMGLPLWLSVVPAILFCMALGGVIEKIAYKPLRNSPRIASLITAIGVSLLLQNIVMKYIGTGALTIPKIFKANPNLPVSVNFIITVVTTAVLLTLLMLYMNKSKYGKAILATSEDYDAARLVGINVNTSISLTFVIGSAVAAVGSLLYVAQYAQITPTMGSMLGIKAFVAAVLGGIGSIPGAVLGGFLLGIVENLTRAYISSQLADAFVFGILVVVLLVKPTGIFGKTMKEKV
ncbi:branched-chain amino acid ABC transporter permease [Peptoniphilus equinus]|uniref:Branched-chain amino acid ABC transporter permease n=1 Tax=Peptoniphilus equinus TaxID=3016343 RepID=A0ABY7QUP3_9FIRM|nr:branched-chain amino acid ABC transporter permease [Peptoniphilus equinus]WBW50509.1 branched-chain amino acid ABC transporter permease [Peptoniphilus equinus]